MRTAYVCQDEYVFTAKGHELPTTVSIMKHSLFNTFVYLKSQLNI